MALYEPLTQTCRWNLLSIEPYMGLTFGRILLYHYGFVAQVEAGVGKLAQAASRMPQVVTFPDAFQLVAVTSPDLGLLGMRKVRTALHRNMGMEEWEAPNFRTLISDEGSMKYGPVYGGAEACTLVLKLILLTHNTVASNRIARSNRPVHRIPQSISPNQMAQSAIPIGQPKFKQLK